MLYWNMRKYTREEFIKAWETSSSILQVAKKLGRNKSGAGYTFIKKAAYELGLNGDHMKTWGLNTTNNRNAASATPFKEILVERSSYTNTSLLKKRLINAGLLKNVCAICEAAEHNGQPVPLQMDHINGKKMDHRLENLRLICPNCHSLTPTYKGRNKDH